MARALIIEGIIEQAKKHPEKPAVIGIDGDGANYADVARLYETTKDFLTGIAVSGKERITVFTGSGIIDSILCLAVIEHAVLVPIDPELSQEQMASSFKLLKVDCIITDKSSHTAVKTAEKLGLAVVLANFTGGMGNFTCSFKLLRRAAGYPSPSQSAADDIASIATTSGTTSTPKIIPKPYSTIYAAMQRNINEYQLNETDKVAVITKIHQNHSYNKIMMSLFTGGTAIVLSGFRHQEFIDMINMNLVTWFVTSPAVLHSLAAYLDDNNIKIDNASLRFIRSSGAPLTDTAREYFSLFFGVPIVQTYGMTETGGITSTFNQLCGHKPGSAGVSIGLEIKILDGEILVRGDSVFHGYEDSEEPNDRYFIDGWFRTGDAGYLDEDGYLFITGRFKEMINRGGEKISPYEVEKYVLQHEAVVEAAAFPIPNTYGSEDLGAAVVLKDGNRFDLIELRNFLQGLVPAYKMPSQLYVVDKIPVGDNGKVQRRMLNDELRRRHPDQDVSGGLSMSGDNDTVETMTETEQILKKIWVKVLKKKNFSIRDNFFALGGDSLKVAFVYSQLERALGITVPLRTMFQKPTIQELADYINARDLSGSGFKFLVPIKDTGYKEPLFCIHAADGEAVTYHSLGEYMPEEYPVYGLRFVLEGTTWNLPVTFNQIGEQYAREIEKVCPDGPFHLCGTCLGGVLAFAVAQALAENGKEVATLVMLDSVYPRGTARPQKMIPLFINSWYELQDYSIRYKMKMIEKKIRTMVSLKFRTSKTKKYLEMSNQMKRPAAVKIPKDVVLSYAHGTYQPHFLNGTIYYFRAVKDKVKRRDFGSQWSNMADHFHVQDMPCRHNEINSPENSKLLAEKLCSIMVIRDE